MKQSIEQAQIKQKGTYDKKYASKHSFEVGSSKTLEEESEPCRGKLDTSYVGPFIILKCHGKGFYCLQLTKTLLKGLVVHTRSKMN